MMSNSTEPSEVSPKWSSTTKMVVSLSVVALFGGALIYFRSIIGPLILAFILAFILHPVASWATVKLHFSWRLSVNLIYLLLLLFLGFSFTMAGIAIVQQAQSLVNFIQSFVASLPDQVAQLSTQVYEFGPFRLDFTQVDLQSIVQQLLSIVQPILGQAGAVLSRLATGAANVVGWSLFVLLISYFLLSEGGHIRQELVHIEIPGYQADFQKLGRKLSIIWDAFLRGQLIISLLVVVSYYMLLTILGTRLTLVIALMAGLARFVPYVGPLVTWSTLAIVVSLQPSNYFGLNTLHYLILVLACCIVLDQIFDNLVVPRILGHSLGVHPAAVLIAAIVATNLIGFVGLVLAAPVLATLALLGRYVARKMFDLEVWPPEEEKIAQSVEQPWERVKRRIAAMWRLLQRQRRI